MRSHTSHSDFPKGPWPTSPVMGPGPLTSIAMERGPVDLEALRREMMSAPLLSSSDGVSFSVHPAMAYEAAKAEKLDALAHLETVRFGAVCSAEIALSQYDENDKESLAVAMELLRGAMVKVRSAEARYSAALDSSVAAAKALGGDR